MNYFLMRKQKHMSQVSVLLELSIQFSTPFLPLAWFM